MKFVNSYGESISSGGRKAEFGEMFEGDKRERGLDRDSGGN